MSNAKRFESKTEIIPFHSCHEWTGHKENGYGRFGFKEDKSWKMKWAHRVSYEMFVGPIPTGKHLDHLCRNRGCVNPKHLDPVTIQENIRRSPLSHARKTMCKKGHEYSGHNLITLKSGNRVCRRCKNDWNNARRRNKRNNG